MRRSIDVASVVRNPFNLTKANDLTDAQIQELWVDVGKPSSPNSLLSLGRFASPMPTFILGSKGSGKTHLMRYASYALQSLRSHAKHKSILATLSADGYVGIYLRCSGLETGRFFGKGIADEAWLEVFSYYLELSLGLSLCSVVEDILNREALEARESAICAAAAQLFDCDAPPAESLAQFRNDLERRRRQLDFDVNNAAFTGALQPNISVSRGRLTFGLPAAIVAMVPELNGVVFAYQLDELENLNVDQQRHVNTLIRERQGPATLKIGARQFGVRTHQTLSAGEENIRDSEYDELRLDQRFRDNNRAYQQLATELITRRLDSFWPEVQSGKTAAGRKLHEWFDEPETGWDSRWYSNLTRADRRPHVERLTRLLRERLRRGNLPGIVDERRLNSVLKAIACKEYPLLEKLNTTLLYNAWANRRDLSQEAEWIAEAQAAFIKRAPSERYKQKLGHFKSDLIAQMVRDAGERQPYASLLAFIRMSEGQPRALLTLLKHTFDWAAFQGERPFQIGKISVDAQSKGALAASEWFYNSMRSSGEEGRSILHAIDRLAELFRLNRFADNPIESSLIGFSVSHTAGSEAARGTLQLCVDRSFLVEISGGQQERNSETVTAKYQLNRMLVARWRLPTGRRGIAPLKADELSAIFDVTQEAEFQRLKATWTSRMYAPFDAQAEAEQLERSQADLFS
jgi:hypothetical protein